MLRTKVYSSLFLIIFTFALSASAQTNGSKSAFAHLQKEHAAALQAWLKSKTNLRPAQVSDCKNKAGLKLMRESESKFHPYYAVYDFDKDGREDFAVVLFDSRQKLNARFTLLVFKGDAEGNFKTAYTLSKIDLRQGGLWLVILEESVTNLHIGEFETDNCGFLHWSNGKLVLRDCESGN